MASQSSPTQLEYGTKLVTPWAGWRIGLYPAAGEAMAVFRSRSGDNSAPGGGVEWDSEAVAVRRARTRVRRYCAANRLNRLGTLTYGPPFCYDPKQLREDVGNFFRRLRRDLGDERFPYLWTGEWHKDGIRLHAHFGVGRFVARARIERAWPHGFVHIKLLGDLPYGSTALAESRLTASYLSKYVAKALQDQPGGLHRYEVGQGFAPRCEGALGSSPDEVLGWAATRIGRWPDFVKPSSEWTAYEGPPAVFASWT